MGKEILLMFRAPATCFPSEGEVVVEVIHVHELQAREVPLLRHSSEAIRATSSAVYSVRSDMDHSPQTAWPSLSSHRHNRSAAGAGRGLHAGSTVLQATRR